jgi:hypothetical protein
MRRIDICCGTIRTTSFGRSTAIGPLSTITRVVAKSWRKEGKLLVGCMVVTLAKQLQRIHVPSVIATDLQGHTMKNLVRVLVKKTPQIKKLQCRQSGLKSLPAEKPNAAIGLKDSDALCTLGTASGAHPPFPLSLTLSLSHWRKVRHWRAASTPDLSATKAATPHPTFTYKNESRKTCVAVSPGEV